MAADCCMRECLADRNKCNERKCDRELAACPIPHLGMSQLDCPEDHIHGAVEAVRGLMQVVKHCWLLVVCECMFALQMVVRTTHLQAGHMVNKPML